MCTFNVFFTLFECVNYFWCNLSFKLFIDKYVKKNDCLYLHYTPYLLLNCGADVNLRCFFNVLLLKWNPIASPTALKSDSPRLHEYELRGISKFLLFSLKLPEETLKYKLFKVI